MALTRPSKLIKEDISGSVVNPTTNISGSSVSTGSFGRTEASAIEGTLVTAAQTNVTSVGTIGTGVWNSTFGATANTLVSGSFTTVSSSLASKVTTLEGTGTAQGVGTTNSPTFADVTATGTVTAQEFHTEFISASVLYDSGSTRFGDTTDDTHAFTGSLTTSGSSLKIDSAGGYSGSVTSTGSFGSLVSPGSLTLGTITTGVWNGTAVASAYLDADTAHLSTTQTFSGAKTFSSAVTADAGVEIDNITIDGTELNLSSGDLTVSSSGRIILSADDNGEIRFQDGTSLFGQFKDDDDRFRIESMIQDKDMMFVGNDGGSEVTALSFDMSESGNAIFAGNVALSTGSAQFSIGHGGESHWGSGYDVLEVGHSMALFCETTDGADRNAFIANNFYVDGDGLKRHYNDQASAILLRAGGTRFYNTTASAENVAFQPATSMYITELGKVGIGTDAPAGKLHIDTASDGDISLNVGKSGLRSGVIVTDANMFINASYANGQGGNGVIAFGMNRQSYSGGTEVMRLLENGNVGIGDTAPVGHVHIKTADSERTSANATMDDIVIEGDAIGISFWATGNSGLNWSECPTGDSAKAQFVYRHSDDTMYLTVNANKTSVWASDGDLTIPGDLTEGSDERIKTNVQTLSSALDKVNQMRGVSFDRLDSGSSSVGLIAQELESIAPELVKTLDSIPIILDDGSEIENSKSICYTNLTAYLIEAVKELSAKVTTLEAQVSGSN